MEASRVSCHEAVAPLITLSVPTPARGLSLIVPVLAPEPDLAGRVARTLAALAQLAADHEILLVVDERNTPLRNDARAVARQHAAVRVLALPVSRFGAMVRGGVRAASKELIAYLAPGASLTAHSLARLGLLTERADLVCGSRIARQDSWISRCGSRAYSLLADVLLGTQVRDCNGVIKIMRRAQFAASSPTADGMFFDAELLADARRNGLSVIEVDIDCDPTEAAARRVPLRERISTLSDLARRWWNTQMFPAADLIDATSPGATGVQRWHIALLVAVAFVMLFTRLTYPLIEPDEARYALIAAEMYDTGDWLVPARDKSYYLDKPPLLYWLTTLSYCVLGVHDYAARVVTASAGMITLLATYFLGRHLVGKRAALLGALVLLLCIGFVLTSRFLIMDGLLTCFTTLTLLMLYIATRGPQMRTGWWLAAALACGLGVMTKGPVMVVLTLPPLWALAWLRGDGARLRWQDWALFGGAVTAIALPWFVAVALREPTFLRYFLWEHHVMRFATKMAHAAPWWFYLPVVLIAMFPASFLLPVLTVYLFRRNPVLAACRTRAQGFLLLTGVWTIAFFSISTGKLAPYILPALPPLCLLLGAMLDRALLTNLPDTFMAWMRRWIPFHGTRTVLIGGVILGVADTVIDYGERDQWLESLLLVVGSSVLYWYVSRREFAERPARWVFAAAVPLTLIAVGVVDVYPSIAKNRSLAAQVARIRAAHTDNSPSLVCYGRYEDSLIFYNRGEDVAQFNIENGALLCSYLADHPRVLILSQDEYIAGLEPLLPRGVRIAPQPFSRGKLYLAETTADGEAHTTASAAPAPDQAQQR